MMDSSEANWLADSSLRAAGIEVGEIAHKTSGRMFQGIVARAYATADDPRVNVVLRHDVEGWDHLFGLDQLSAGPCPRIAKARIKANCSAHGAEGRDDE